jgi:DNA-binding MarR family transcriptional regulator
VGGRREVDPESRVLDSVDALLADWARERPDLDFSPVGVVTRLARVRAHLDAALVDVFARYDLSAADFVAVVSLRRAGAPYRLPQVQLAQQLGLTAGTVSVRIDRLVARGVVVREPDESDRRLQWVRLTEQGLDLFDRVAPVHLANEDRLLSALDEGQRAQLAGLLRTLLASFEHETVRVGSLGLELLEAHAARARRTSVGLSDVPGLLVAAPPRPGSPAAAAGLQQGDLLTAVGDAGVRSCASLARALEAAAGRALPVEYLRAEERHRATFPAR